MIAHPLSLYLSWSKIEPVLEDFRSRGVLGLEAYHPGARVAKCEHLERIARKLDFFVTAGSDFHHKNLGHEAVSAIRTKDLPKDSYELAKILKSGDYALEIGEDAIVLP